MKKEDYNVTTQRELKLKLQAAMDEQKILKEIEDSFCVAGYEIISSSVFKESIEQKFNKVM